MNTKQYNKILLGKGISLLRRMIWNKGRETRDKRKSQAAKSFEIKLDKSKISKRKNWTTWEKENN